MKYFSLCVQAANLLRALRQSREAVALGLIEGVQGERGAADIEVEAQKDRNLTRRTWRLARFLIEHLNKEESAGLLAKKEDPGFHQTSMTVAQQETTPTASAEEAEEEDPTPSTEIERIFAVLQKQKTTCISKKRPDQIRYTRSFQIDLQYPPAQHRPHLLSTWKPSAELGSGLAGGISSSRKGSTASSIAMESAQSSLSKSISSSEPLSGVGLSSTAKDKSNDADTKGGCDEDSTMETNRPTFADVLAASLRTSVEMRAWFDEQVSYQFVRQERIPTALPEVLVVNCGLEDRENLAWWQPIRVKAQDRNHTEWLPTTISIASSPKQWEVAVAEGKSIEEADHRLKSKLKNFNGAIKATYTLTAVISHIVDEDEAAIAGEDYEGHMIAQIKVPFVYFQAQSEMVICAAAPAGGIGTSSRSDVVMDLGTEETTRAASPSKANAVHLDPDRSAELDVSSSQLSTKTIVSPTSGSDVGRRPAIGNQDPKGNWMLFNDFRITECSEFEVVDLYSGQKAPALLFFTREANAEEMSVEAVTEPPVPVLSDEEFLTLCRSPSIQTNRPRVQEDLPFEPLESSELPRPGMLFALDAEFVAYSPPEKVVRRGFDVEARPPRLGLGRVSVVRGEGARAGVPCIDDYIRSVEPVYDYLTRYSGLVHGDLDPAYSKHYLTTLRRAYLKLRYMVDAGSIFVGHGLEKDFRMLNIAVPKEQIVDTSDLFYSGQGRRVSLRFLAAYLLGSTIQGGAHDSIEDAMTALKLYRVYQELVEQGVFERTLTEMFSWGATEGWDPDSWKRFPELHA